MIKYLLVTLLISLSINILGFLVAYRLKTDKLTDFSYALSFVALNTVGLIITQNFNWANFVLVGAVTLWALRLGTYLVIRIKQWGRDKRFDGVRENFLKFLQFWFFQGLTAWVVSVATLQFVKLNTEPSFTWLSAVGLLIFITGLVVETTADLQLFNFSKNKQKSGKFIKQGLWKYSRHPNYLGEISVWIGLWVYTLPILSTGQAILGFISPLFIFLMIRFVSGVPKLEKNAEAKWGSRKDYQDYKKKTGLILPKLFRIHGTS